MTPYFMVLDRKAFYRYNIWGNTILFSYGMSLHSQDEILCIPEICDNGGTLLTTKSIDGIGKWYWWRANIPFSWRSIADEDSD